MKAVRKPCAEVELVDGGIDAGLLLLAAATPRGVERTQAEIAFVCGCTTGYIYYLERCAKEKVRRAFEERGLAAALPFDLTSQRTERKGGEPA